MATVTAPVSSTIVEMGESLIRSIDVPKLPPMREFLIEEFRDEDGGRFNPDLVPWVMAPNGPCDAIDNPQFNELIFQWASRMFKTTFGQQVQCRQALHDPIKMMFVTSGDELLKRILERWYETLDANPLIARRLPKAGDRNAKSVDFGTCKVIGTHAGSKTGLRDARIRVGHLNEVDAWDLASTSHEGDPVNRAIKRGGEFPDYDFIIESTPLEYKKSRIRRRRKRSTDCRYWVQCPKCGRFQELIFGDGKKPGGIFWDKLHGKNDINLALRTAYYVCRHCEGYLRDEDRWVMMASGVWVPNGCHVDDDAATKAREADSHISDWLRGEPFNNGKLYGSHISYIYHPTPGWGELAYDFLVKRQDPDDFRNWVQEDMGRCWRMTETEPDWMEVARRIRRPGTIEGVIPDGYNLVTIQIDRQGEDNERGQLPFMVLTWDYERRCHIMKYGYCQDEAEAVALIKTLWPHADDGAPVRCSRLVLDTGFEPEEQEKLAQRIKKELKAEGIEIHITLVKGAKTELPTLFKITELGEKTANAGMVLTWVDSGRSQRWVEQSLHDVERTEPGGLGVWDGDEDTHGPMCAQLLNDVEDEKGRWDRRNHELPNDMRDTLRYGKVGMERHLQFRGWMNPPHRVKNPVKPPPEKPKPHPEDRQRSGFIRKPKGFGRRSR